MSVVAWLKRKFQRTVKPRADARVFDTRTAFWGNNVEWLDIATRRVVGWTEPLPQVGDVLKSPMQSGRVGLFVFTQVEPCRNPNDMFFGHVEQVGYEELPS